MDLCANFYIVLDAVRDDRMDLRYVSADMRANKLIVRCNAKWRNLATALKYASKTITSNKRFVSVSIKRDLKANAYIADSLKIDGDIAVLAT